MAILRRTGERGSTLISVLMAVGISSVVMVALSSMTTHGVQGAQSAGVRQDIETTKMTIRDGLSCAKTLGVTEATKLPLRCSDYPKVTLRRKDGKPMTVGGKLGAWTVTAGCDDKAIVVGVTKKGVDPLTGKTYASRPAAKDLFNGTSKLCHHYFTGETQGYVYAGKIYRCPYEKSGGPGSFKAVSDFNKKRSPGGTWINSYSGTTNCPKDFKPTYSWAFWNGSCSGGQSGMYFQCGWNAKTGAYAGGAASGWADSELVNNPSTNRVSEVTHGLGCGLEIYDCLKPLYE